MHRFLKFFTVLSFSLLFAFALSAQDRFDDIAQLPAQLPLDVGGFGNIVAGVDLDGDGKLEIYAVNNDWFDTATLDYIPRIYKYEQDADGNWEIVWQTEAALTAQNTWPALAVADLDKDGKQEIVWGPVNNFDGGPNPERIMVYETQGDGSDIMGVPAATYYRPNAQWTINQADNENNRPIRWEIQDLDGDGVDEIAAGIRSGGGIQVYSVDNVPDAADSTETWKLEFSGLETVWDINILNGTIYGFRSGGDVYIVKSAEADSFYVADTLVGLLPGGGWLSASVVDVDGDNTDELLVAAPWLSATDAGVYLLEEDADTLKASFVVDLPSAGNRPYGGAAGDVDGDGNVDFVFGTRQSNPNGLIYRAEYQGGDKTDANNWQLSAIDENINKGTQYDIFDLADLDDDGEDEILYTGTARGISLGEAPPPITILDRISENQPTIETIADVPNDQGRQVWVIWKGSSDDMVPNLKKESLSIAINAPKGVEFPFARINGLAVNTVPVGQELSTIAAAGDIVDYVVWRIDDGVPVHVSTTRSIQSDMYASVVPTLGDSMDTKYVVSAHTATPAINWKSFAKTGFSLDNLIPTAPGKVAAKEAETGIEVSWEESPDVDFNYFSIRRGTESGFNAADISTEIGTTTSINFLDEGISNDTPYFYRVVAYDFNGNQGELSAEVSAAVTDVEGLSQALPTEFALNQNYPNPFNPTTTIAFDLPENVDVSIVIYNTLGHKVRTLVNESKVAGSYRTVWDGLNDSGARVATGIYIYNIRAGKFTESRRMTLIK